MILIVANIAVFFVQLGLPGNEVTRFLYTYALVPAVYGHPDLARQAGLDPDNYWPLLTNTFMHAGYLHMIVNMWTPSLFGAPRAAMAGPERHRTRRRPGYFRSNERSGAIRARNPKVIRPLQRRRMAADADVG